MDCGLISGKPMGSFSKQSRVDWYGAVLMGLDLIWAVGSRSNG